MEKLVIIKTIQQLNELEAELADKDFIAFDTETTGLDKDANIIGFSVSVSPEIGYYVILSYWDVQNQKLSHLETKELAKSFLSKLTAKNLIMHNASFDCYMVENNFGINLMSSVHTDTMLLGHLLDENRSNGLKELGASLFGEDSRKEQKEMKESVYKNGGVLTKDKYELYKADAYLLAKYGAKDAILTIKLFYSLVPELYEQKLDIFFYEDETMPLLRGPTYDMNTTGLKVDPNRLQDLKMTLEAECLELKAYIFKEITPHVKDKYPATKPNNTFNISASKQLAWLLFDKLGNEFNNLTKGGKELCKALDLKIPYAPSDKRYFIKSIVENKGRVYAEATYNAKTKKMSRPKKVADYWHYLACGKETITKLSKRYKWAEKLLIYAKNQKLLKTYVEGIQSRVKYGVIRPNFLQHGTTSGRYSCKNPNFQNLPRDDKRIKSCIISRPGKAFVGADYSQLEPRIFASIAQAESLLACFKKGEDFYSVVGAPIFGVNDCSLTKEDPNSFAKKYPTFRDQSKVISLATPYGRTANQQAAAMGIDKEEAQDLIDRYFAEYPEVYQMMIDSHEMAKSTGVVYNLFGRPRRIPEAKNISRIYGKNTPHSELPYVARTLLNLAMNHRVQSTGASIMNRAAIACNKRFKELETGNPLWKEVKIIMQVHDELIIECPEDLATAVAAILKDCMENAAKLPGVDLIAEPKIANNLADLK